MLLENLRKPVTIALLVAGSGMAAADFETCGPLTNAYGPFDYYVDKDKLPIVERYHFTPDVEFLRRGEPWQSAGDLAYTLHAFPNHPRALAAMVRLSEIEKQEKLPYTGFTTYCYLERAVRFRPDDGNARVLMADYLIQRGRRDEAVEHIEHAAKLASDGGNLHYNLGLLFLRLGRYDDSLTHAHRAAELGFDLPGLKKLLVAAGKWRDPQPKAKAD